MTQKDRWKGDGVGKERMESARTAKATKNVECEGVGGNAERYGAARGEKRSEEERRREERRGEERRGEVRRRG